MHIKLIIWNGNTYYAIRRATRAEIEEILTGPDTRYRRNLRGRAASHLATGRTSAGRPLIVAFIYYAHSQAALPINAWEG